MVSALFNQKNLLVLLLALIASTSLSAQEAQKFGADKHVAKGVTCQTCHGEDLKNINYPDKETCTQCHNQETLAEKTKELPGANPHKAPHNDDCTLCHMQHEPQVNYCNQCHSFKFQMKN